ncbi:MAG: cobyrinate a,c-diamide synthase [Lachnospiraceae bacterium]|nr:cobyrinate a,c-diamide synthase [Lachnospiraceae bacterium]
MRHPRILIAAPSSGSGKTTAVCVLLTLLKRRGLDVKACKCGPDYIDPMFHTSVLDIPCTNLDPFFCDRQLITHLLSENAGADITVIEGVMGYYDGTGEDGTDNSTFTVASATSSPVILVVNARGAAASLLAVIEGFLDFMPASGIKGILFNQMTAGTYTYISKLMQNRFGDQVIPVGYIPALPKELTLPSRHLGLVTAAEIEDLLSIINRAADLCEGTIDIDKLLAISQSAPALDLASPVVKRFPQITVAVAKDNAFCFYYKDTFRLLEKMGAEIRYFSPLNNEPVPDGADALIIGGGYPELYTETLEANENTKASVRAAAQSGMPVIAECGGFQYLGSRLCGREMCSVLPHETFATDKLVRFGYVDLTAQEDGLLGPAGTRLKAHEFHYYDSSDNGSSFKAVKPNGKSWSCAVSTDTMYAGYPHLFLYANIPAAESFYQKALEYKEKKNDN